MGGISLTQSWRTLMQQAIVAMLADESFVGSLSIKHIEDTPRRVVKMYEELFSGCNARSEDILNTTFDINSTTAGMVVIKDIDVISCCQHHLLPFMGKAHFGYVPCNKIVGLSKIPRMIDALARRPQIQEQLTNQIVTEFTRIVGPQGCGVVIEAMHTCMCIRGVKAMGASTKTIALSGVFLKRESVKREFMDQIK